MIRFVRLSVVFVQLGLVSLNGQFCKKLCLRSINMAHSDITGICKLATNFSDWQFSNFKLLELPIDEIKDNFLRRNNAGCLFSNVNPTPLKLPNLVAYSKDVLTTILNMDPSITQTQEFADFIAGNTILNNSIPLAHRYGGHQFGYWATQLGDGRAILLGEFINSAGERWELQLKGSGKTPYSRDGDGRAVLRSSIREFLCSEAMFYLGIPTSRAAAIVVSDERAFRDPLYDGNPVMEKTAVVLRLAPSWFRFGSFELPAKTNELDLLKKLFDFILKEHFPDIDPTSDDRVLTFLSRVSRLTSDLVVAWQGVGFTHGVLNTDNMSVLGLTIDYGPFGFVEAYQPEYVPNASDHEARYCYIRQPDIIMYNLMKLSQALSPLLTESQRDQVGVLLSAEVKYIEDSLMKMFSAKLGLPKSEPGLVVLFMTMLEETKSDFTMTFRDLSEIELEHVRTPCPGNYWALANLAQHAEYPRFISLYSDKLKEAGVSEEVRHRQMCERNPRYVLRNWIAQKAIMQAEEGNYVEVERLLRVLSTPFTKQEEAEKMGFAGPPPDWAAKLRLSCSS
ncbi:protein adenylyltransferase SelO-like [Homalodisca vitripennis]|uniref:protein adenylyltransferase SelO-like n=1 Tax=Homalodisca vitripennis TaxID=197043 RepID=UPI001EEA17A2|nr:protein adenylyltransferase SelO-like [Homalodisca vitripennis]